MVPEGFFLPPGPVNITQCGCLFFLIQFLGEILFWQEPGSSNSHRPNGAA